MSWVGSLAEEERCQTLVGLVKRQRRLCRRNVELMDSVKTGALMAIEECQAQFQNRRWNCSTTDSKNLFGRVILKQGIQLQSRRSSLFLSQCLLLVFLCLLTTSLLLVGV